MIRGMLAALAVAVVATGPAAAPVQAKGPVYVVYEVYRVRTGGPVTVPVRVRLTPAPGRMIVMMAGLQPRGKLGWTAMQRAVSVRDDGDTRWRTYGWPRESPAPAPDCPAAPLCGTPSPGPGGGGSSTVTFQANVVTRFLVAAPRGRLSLLSLSGWWRVRESTAKFRTVTAEESDATGLVNGVRKLEYFRSAKAAAGPYGSLAFGSPPCDNGGSGRATLSPGDTQSNYSINCKTGEFSETPSAPTWTLAGPLVGSYFTPYRLSVLDYPKL